MKSLFDHLLNLVFPPRCEVCRRGCAEALCAECFSQIRFTRPHMGIHTVSIYEGTVRAAIHRFKFKKRRRLAEPLGVLLVRYLGSNPLLSMGEIEVIVPVPLHRKRLRQRGFNQAELLAAVVSRYFEVPVVPVLERVRDTRAQFGLARMARFRNVAGAFRVSDVEAVSGRRVMLLDDIYTTGSTIAECSRALHKAGARRVEVLTLSRAPDDS